MPTPDDHQTDALEQLREAVNYRSWLVGLAAPWLGQDVLEVGSGFGDYAAELAARGFDVTATEADPVRAAALAERFALDDGIGSRLLSLPAHDDDIGRFDSVVAFNVLEHIEDDVAAMASIRHLAPRGTFVAVVPAVPLAMSRFDRSIGHHRRYTKEVLEGRVRAAGLEVVRCHYVNLVGLAGWLVFIKLLRGTPRWTLPLRIYDRLLPTLAALERRRPPPIGQSLLLVARPSPT